MVIIHLYVSGDTLWAGTAHRVGNLDKSGLYRSIDGGKNWVQLDSDLWIGEIAGFYIDEERTKNIYIIKGDNAYTPSGTFYKTTDGGENWQEVQSVAVSNSVAWFEISAFNKNDIYFIEVGYTNILYRTTDGGVTWKEIGSFPSDSHGNRVTVTLDLLHDSTLYASVKTSLLGAFFYKSTDKGDSWFFVSTPPGVASEIYTDYFLPDRIYLIKYVSNNSGLNWFEADSGFNMNGYYLSFYQDRQTSKLLYKLRTDGLYSSSNVNFYWSKVEGTESLPIYLGPTGFYEDKNMKNIFIEPVTRELFLGTAKGIYKTAIITHTEDEIKNPALNFILKQNFPNPFNPATTIEYQLKNRAFVSLKVYDILGNEIITLVSEEQPAGNYKVTFNIGIIRSYNFTSGVYIYQIQAGTYVSSRKMIYLK